MKDTRHTPGPWRVESYDSIHQYAEIVAGFETIETVRICDVPSWPCAEEEMKANARLIAAAPDLLNLMTAATRLDELTGDNLAVYARTFAALARAAIDRATGNQ